MSDSEPGGAGSDDPPSTPADVQYLLARRAGEYLDLWQGAAAKFSSASYRSEDLLDDWFSWYGKAARDATAAAALLWGTLARGANGSGEPPGPRAG